MITEKIDNYLNEAKKSYFPYFPNWIKVYDTIYSKLLDFEQEMTDAFDQEIGDSKREKVKVPVIRKMESISDKVYKKLEDAISNLEEVYNIIEEFEIDKELGE